MFLLDRGLKTASKGIWVARGPTLYVPFTVVSGLTLRQLDALGSSLMAPRRTPGHRGLRVPKGVRGRPLRRHHGEWRRARTTPIAREEARRDRWRIEEGEEVCR